MSGPTASRWRALVFAPTGGGATRRRGTEVFRVTTAILLVLLCWIGLLAGAGFERSIVRFVSPPPFAISWLVTTAVIAASYGAIAVVAVLALVSRRRPFLRDVAVAAAGSLAIAFLLETQLGPGNGRLGHLLAHVDVRFPLPRVAVATAVMLAAAPYLARGLKRTVQVVILVEAVATVVHGSGLVTTTVASVAIGWGAAAAVALAFGSPLGMPSAEDVEALLAEMHLDGYDVTPAPNQDWGVARFIAAGDGEALWVSVYGRDAHDAQVASKALRFVLYRDSGPTLTLTRLQQVEHEAYVTMRAAMAGATVPELVSVARVGPRRDAVLVMRPPRGAPLSSYALDGDEGDAVEGAPAVVGTDIVPDQALRAVFLVLADLRTVRLAHGRIGPSTILIDGDGAALSDFRSATADASDLQLARDTASTLATVALVAGPPRTLAAARAVLGDDPLVVALPFLQRGALSAELGRVYRKRQPLLDAMRTSAAEELGVTVPELAEAKRISWANLVIIGGSVIGGWALVGVLVNVGKSFGTIVGADWGWVLGAFLFAFATVPSLALEVTGAVSEPLPFGRVAALEMADAFVGLAGGGVAVLATRVRFLQRQGYDATLAVSSAVLLTTVSWITKALLFVLALPFATEALHMATSTSGSGAGLVRLLVIIAILVPLAVGLVLVVPRLRRLAADKLRPRYEDVRSQLTTLRDRPRKLAAIFGGATLAQVCVVLSLGCAVRAFDDHVSFATLIVIVTLASVLGGASPSPGGIGVAEAGLIFGLSSVGVPEADAVGAVFIQRLFTTYLPPFAGWPVLVAMRRRGYL